jgi:Phytanoyl-CoA dioxygenase (PhyH)
MQQAPIGMTEEIVAFLERIGVPVRFEEIAEPTFLPGIAVIHGVLTIDASRLLYPGDLLHEAGHLAMLPPSQRALANGPLGDDGGFEMAAIAWSWGAAIHLGLDPTVVFHDAGYRGGSRAIHENFLAGRYIGLPLLEWAGLTTAATYPELSPWLRDELGVRHLRQFWRKPDDVDWVTKCTLLCGLGLGLHETFDYLMRQRPSFAEFEAWIMAKNGGTVDAAEIARLNIALSEPGKTGQSADLGAEPALSAEDLAFWDENGYVILHDAVTPENCHAAVQAICEFLGADLDRPESWYRGAQGRSIWIPLLHHPAIRENRIAPRIHRAFAQLWNREDLWGTVDQAGFNPPEKAGWQFPGPHLHWDVSLARPIPFGVQGILYLTDTAANQGAFTCVPGFHRRIDRWLESLPAGSNAREQDLSGEAMRIAGRAGDLVIWHHALPHGSSPNSAAVPRFVQYISKRPSHWGYSAVWV